MLPLLCAVTLGPAAALPAQECGAGRFLLEEQQRIELPPSAGIAGVLATPDGGLLLWTADGRVLTVNRAGRTRVTPLADSIYPVGLAPLGAETGFRLFDATQATQWQLGGSRGETADHRYAIDPDLALDQAIAEGDGWLVLSRDVARRTAVLLRVGATGVAELYRSEAGHEGGPAPRLRLSTAGDTLLLTRSTAPFTVLRLDRRGHPIDSLAAPPLPIPPESLSTWRAQAAVPLDCGVLLPLANLAGDQRLLLRFDNSGRFRLLTAVDAPIGFVASRPDAQELIAARRVGALELVRYSWRWIPDGDAIPPESARSSQ